MAGKITLNNVDKILLVFSSIYLMITSLISLWFIFVLINEDIELKFLIILTLIVGLFIIGLTLWTNAVLLSKLDSIGKKEITINSIICLIQSFSFFLDGFRFKYLQGLEYVLFIHIDQTFNRFERGIIFLRPAFEFVFNFMSTQGIFIGVNIIALTFLFFFIYTRRKYFKLSAI